MRPDRLIVGERLDFVANRYDANGVIRRHHFSSNRASHGNSRSHNTPGSIGMAQDPGRVFPGKRMAGQYGNVQRTVQKLKVVRVDKDRQLLLVKGAVPGADGTHIVVHPSVPFNGAQAWPKRCCRRSRPSPAPVGKAG